MSSQINQGNSTEVEAAVSDLVPGLAHLSFAGLYTLPLPGFYFDAMMSGPWKRVGHFFRIGQGEARGGAERLLKTSSA